MQIIKSLILMSLILIITTINGYANMIIAKKGERALLEGNIVYSSADRNLFVIDSGKTYDGKLSQYKDSYSLPIFYFIYTNGQISGETVKKRLRIMLSYMLFPMKIKNIVFKKHIMYRVKAAGGVDTVN